MAEVPPEEQTLSQATPAAPRPAPDDPALGQPVWQVDLGDASGTNAPAAAAPSPLALSPTVAERGRGEEAPPPVLRILEALLFVGGVPLTAERACAILRGLTPTQFAEALDTLNRDYRRQGRPYLIQAQEQGYLLALRPRFRQVLDRLYGQVREARLSPVAIDVLSLVAYRQPATKQEVDSIRGAESGSLLRQLVRRGLIAVVHRGEAAHREVAYGTTARFLEFFGLRSLEDLPQTHDLQQL